MKAWHFTDGNKLRDGSPLPAIGETLRHEGELIACESGLHASKRLIDALNYAPGSLLHRVKLSGAEAQGHTNEVVARERTILWSVDAEPMLRDFARRCALDVVHFWDAPEVVVQYLKTGDERLRKAARDAAARDAAEASRATVWAVTGAARASDRFAVWAAAGAARASIRATSWAAAKAARTSDWATAWTAVRAASKEKQNRRLTSMMAAAYNRHMKGK